MDEFLLNFLYFYIFILYLIFLQISKMLSFLYPLAWPFINFYHMITSSERWEILNFFKIIIKSYYIKNMVPSITELNELRWWFMFYISIYCSHSIRITIEKSCFFCYHSAIVITITFFKVITLSLHTLCQQLRPEKLLLSYHSNLDTCGRLIRKTWGKIHFTCLLTLVNLYDFCYCWPYYLDILWFMHSFWCRFH